MDGQFALDYFSSGMNIKSQSKTLPEGEVIRYLREISNSLFDPRLVNLFLTIMET